MIKSRVMLLSLSFVAATMLVACSNEGADEMRENSATPAEASSAALTDIETSETFLVSLTGAAERPDPVATTASADATIIVYTDSIIYVVSGLSVKGVTAAHIHRGGAEEAGPVLATLYTSDAGADFDKGLIANGTITRETTLSDGVTFDQLRELVRTGAAYLNVHTTVHPKGELRSQTVPDPL